MADRSEGNYRAKCQHEQDDRRGAGEGFEEHPRHISYHDTILMGGVGWWLEIFFATFTGSGSV